MAIDIKYEKEKLTIGFTDSGWEVWQAKMLFRQLYLSRWQLRITDRDRGFIEDIYRKMVEAGVDFKELENNYPKDASGLYSEFDCDVRDSMAKLLDELKNTNERLKKVTPNLSITFPKDEEVA